MFLIQFCKKIYNIVLLCIKNDYICEFYVKHFRDRVAT